MRSWRAASLSCGRIFAHRDFAGLVATVGEIEARPALATSAHGETILSVETSAINRTPSTTAAARLQEWPTESQKSGASPWIGKWCMKTSLSRAAGIVRLVSKAAPPGSPGGDLKLPAASDMTRR